jgi:hypothetical protein
MKYTIVDKAVAWLTLLSALSISVVAIYYSVIGLTAIFAAAVIPIIVMGIVLESGKLVATLWLKYNWDIAPKLIKIYLIGAVFVLMSITSMGIFGYLSKAHLDQAVPAGDVAGQVTLIDERIKVQQDILKQYRVDLDQLNAQINRYTELGAVSKGVKAREAQAEERNAIINKMEETQKKIGQLREERVPLASAQRKVEAEVGPIKYIAALIYGDNPDANLLEKSVRWVIIVIVAIFDPLAVAMLLASQFSFGFYRNNHARKDDDDPDDTPPTDDKKKTDDEQVKEEPKIEVPVVEIATAATTAAVVSSAFDIVPPVEPPKEDVKEDEDEDDDDLLDWDEDALDEMFDDAVEANETDNNDLVIDDFFPEEIDQEFKEEVDQEFKDDEVRVVDTPNDFFDNLDKQIDFEAQQMGKSELDELDKIYGEGVAAVAKAKRSRGWLGNSLPEKE